MTGRPRLLPRIRTLLLATYLVVLLLPVAGIGILRLYESALIRQTEAELLAQAAVLSAAYRAAWLERSTPAELDAMPRVTRTWTSSDYPPPAERSMALTAQLDLADTTILPPPPAGTPSAQAAEPIARQAAGPLASVVDEARRMTLAALRIVDARGVVVVSSTPDELGFSLAAQDEVAHALQGAPMAVLRARVGQSFPGWETISRNSELRVYVAVPVLADGRVLGAVLVSRTPRNIAQTLYAKRYALIELAVVLLAAVAALAWFTGRTIVRPTRQLAVMANRVASGDVRAVEPLGAPMTREAQSLSDSILTMARTLEARTDYVRDLALGISHEFKTPLTAIRGGAELLRDHLDDMSAEERQRFLGNILDDTARLERLVRRLLELAQADALMPTGRETCDVGALLRDKADDFRRQGGQIAVEEGPAAVLAAVDRASLDIVLSNLLENVRQHGGAQATVGVAWRLDDGSVVIDVHDDGAGISAANTDRIFDRFFTTARDAGGTGLGLAIARRRLAAFGGTLVLVPSVRGARFEIRLKRAPQTPR